MLKTLDIENIAVIEKTSVEFSGGLNVLTGETGAGKSIVVDSINAILGERTSKELVRHGAQNGFVSAYFDTVGSSACKKLEDLGFDTDDDGGILLSRRIGANGKSVCRINGKTATVSMLREIGALLVNIHGQHDSQALLDPKEQYRYIDMLLDDKKIIDEYRASFKELLHIRKRIKALAADEDAKRRELELLDYQIDELESADIKIGERDELSARKKLITQSGKISEALNNIIMLISGDDNTGGIRTAIDDAYNQAESFDETKSIADILADISDKLELVSDESKGLIEQIDFLPGELEKIEERLDLLYDFSNKYGSDEAKMLDFLEKAKERRKSLILADEELENLNLGYDALFQKTVDLADRLSAERKKTAEKFEKAVKSELEFLDMPKLKFVVNFGKGKLSSIGYDDIQFLISTNPGEPPKPLSKIASGGELSRIMLAIKNITAYNDTIPTLIFDEIDTGVSGRASRKIGLKLKSVSENAQVICVTHSAQIAAVADNHYLVRKEYDNNRTFTGVTLLDFDGRVKELAGIMGGIDITDSLMKSAEELLLDNKNGN